MCSVTVSQVYSGTAADLISAIQKAVAAHQADVNTETRRPPPPPPPPPPSSTSDIDVASLVQALMAADTDKDGSLSSDELLALSESAVPAQVAVAAPGGAIDAEPEIAEVGRAEEPDAPPPEEPPKAAPEPEQSPLGTLENAMAMKAADNGAPTDATLARRFLTLLAEVG